MERFVILLVGIVLLGCNNAKHKDNSLNQLKIVDSIDFKVDKSQLAILQLDTTQDWTFKNCKRADLSDQELVIIEKVLMDCIEFYNTQQLNHFRKLDSIYPNRNFDMKQFTIELKDYKRQYIPVINMSGEKEVWVNCFCQTMGHDWKTEEVFILDGGNCFFNLKINIDTKKYYDFMVNGEA